LESRTGPGSPLIAFGRLNLEAARYFACASIRERMPETAPTHKQKNYSPVIFMCNLHFSCANLVLNRILPAIACSSATSCLPQRNVPQQLTG
jgi:hypothetical protein